MSYSKMLGQVKLGLAFRGHSRTARGRVGLALFPRPAKRLDLTKGQSEDEERGQERQCVGLNDI
jgi:hypothetical protein